MATAYMHPGVYVEELQGPQQITGVTTSTTVFVGPTERAPGSGELDVAPLEAMLVTSWNDYAAKFGGFLWGKQVPFAVYTFFAQGGSLCYVVSTPPGAGDTPATVATLPGIQIHASSGGVWGNDLAIMIAHFPPPPAGTPLGSPPTPVFMMRVLYKVPATPAAEAKLAPMEAILVRYAKLNNLPKDATGDYYVLEEYVGLTENDLKTPGPAPSTFETRINQSLFVRVSLSGRDPVTGAAAVKRPPNTPAPVPMTNGYDAPTPIDYEAAYATLDPLDDINLLVVPDTVMHADPGDQRIAIQEALDYCDRTRPRRDLFLIADSPFAMEPQDIRSFKTGEKPAGGNALNSSYGALYYPWLDFNNSVTGRRIPIPPSGAIAGTYAATDQRVGVFKAPAGITDGRLDVATGVERLITATEQDVLNPYGINAIRNLQRYGICTYGARTLSTDPSLTYVNVRRVLTYIETSLYWGTQWVVFEPNDQKLWGAVLRDVTEFLTTLWQQGALFGATPSQAFSVQCDEHNNPASARNQGQLYIDILVAPVRPAEFVVIRIQQATLGSS